MATRNRRWRPVDAGAVQSELDVTPALIIAAALALRVALGVGVWRRDRSYGPIVLWSGALLAVWGAQAAADALSLGQPEVSLARVTVAAIGTWAIAAHAIEGRSTRVPIAVAAAILALSAHPGVPIGAREWTRTALFALGGVGAWWSIQRALRQKRVPKPGLAQLVALLYAAMTAAQLVAADAEGFARALPALAATGSALAVEVRWLARTRRAAAHVGDRDEQLRPAERVGDLVELAQTVRSRGDRGASEPRSAREP